MRDIDVERVDHIIEGGDELRGVLRDNSDLLARIGQTASIRS